MFHFSRLSHATRFACPALAVLFVQHFGSAASMAAPDSQVSEPANIESRHIADRAIFQRSAAETSSYYLVKDTLLDHRAVNASFRLDPTANSSRGGRDSCGVLTHILQGFEDGTPLKMEPFEGSSYMGDLTRRNAGVYLVAFDRFDERRLFPDQVGRLWIQSGDRGTGGMLIGAGIGFVALGLLGAYAVGGFAEDSYPVVLIGLSFAFLGTVPGAAVGALLRQGGPRVETPLRCEIETGQPQSSASGGRILAPLTCDVVGQTRQAQRWVQSDHVLRR